MTSKIAWPLTRAGRPHLVTVEQDSLEDVAQCVHILTRTPIGSRPLAPLIGFEDPTFDDAEEQDIAGPMAEWEPRARLTVAVETSAHGTRQVRRVTVAFADDPTPLEAA